jgi:hypothetical protein
MRVGRLFICRSGAAAAEMAIAIPLLLILLLSSLELGNYFLNEHMLQKGLRDGARYAARQAFSNFSTCSGSIPTPGVSGSVFENTKLIVRKGSLSSSVNDRLPNWSSATFNATASCSTAAGAETLSGIYSGNKNSSGTLIGAPIVTVSASINYQPLVGVVFGFSGRGIKLNGAVQSAVMGV